MEDSAGASHLAEFGVVFLMFSIGLEFSLTKLHAMTRIVSGLVPCRVIRHAAAVSVDLHAL